MAMFQLRHISFYEYGNEFTGSLDTLRYRIVPEDEKLHVWTWFQDVCFALADAGDPKEFPLSAEGLESVQAYLEEQYAARPRPKEIWEE